MKPLVAWIKRARGIERQKTTWTKGFQDLIERQEMILTKGMKDLLENIRNKEPVCKDTKVKGMSQVVKLVKVPSWTCAISLETYMKLLDIWKIATQIFNSISSMRI